MTPSSDLVDAIEAVLADAARGIYPPMLHEWARRIAVAVEGHAAGERAALEAEVRRLLVMVLHSPAGTGEQGWWSLETRYGPGGPSDFPRIFALLQNPSGEAREEGG